MLVLNGLVNSGGFENREWNIEGDSEMKKWATVMAAGILSLAMLSGCGDRGSENAAGEGRENGTEETLDWQSQYELGLRLLNEGSYEEAILAFTAAIEIDPNRAASYVNRGDAYMAREAGTGEGADSATGMAAADYAQAVTLLSRWYGGEAGSNMEDGGQTAMLPERMNYADVVSRAVELFCRLAEECVEREDYEAALEAVKRADDILTGCIIAEDGSTEEGTPGIPGELWEKLQREVSELLETYERLADGRELNAYGATVFEQRERYRPYDEMPAEEQARVERLAEIARTGNVDALAAELPDSETRELEVFTSRDTWRIYIWRFYNERPAATEIPGEPWPYDDDPGIKDASIMVEVREENGKGYACYYSRREGYRGGGELVDGIWVYSTGTHIAKLYASGTCEDWQWEGLITSSLTEEVESYKQGEWENSFVGTETGRGNMSGGVREGDFSYDHSYQYNSPFYEDSSEYMRIVTYHGGVCTEHDYEVFKGALELSWDTGLADDMSHLETVFW